MISASVIVSESAQQIGVQVIGPLLNPRGLNAVLAQRLANELKDHFRAKNAEPNNKGWRKTGFWAQVSRATAVDNDSITDHGAVVVVSDVRFAIHLFGGTIKPTQGRKWLTIPLVEEARGLRVDSYEKKFKRELFRIGYIPLLFEKRSRGGTQSLIGAETGRRRDGSETSLNARQQLRPIYALATSVTIKEDRNALPPAAAIQAALADEANKFIERQLAKGGQN